MQKIDLAKAKPLKEFKVGMRIRVNDKMQKNYTYTLTQPVGKNFAEDFQPQLTPAEMLKLGVFEGKYLNDCVKEFPREWYKNALNKLSPEKPDISKNLFQIKSRLSLEEWIKRGWIIPPDVRGWFQWYCRYYLGRRIPEVDAKQIKRYKAFTRHLAQVKKNCLAGDLGCRKKQRQALLQWGYNPFI